MCSPTLALAGISAFTSGVSAFAQQEAHNRAADYNSQIATQNAAISENRAEDAKKRGRVEALRIRQEGSKVIGAQRASFASAGVTVDSGSAFDAINDTTISTELDALTTIRNSVVESNTYLDQADAYKAQASFQKATKVSPFVSAGLAAASSAQAFAPIFTGSSAATGSGTNSGTTLTRKFANAGG